MIFVFGILIFINYVTISKNYVLKKNIKGNNKGFIREDVRNRSFFITTQASLFEIIENSNPIPNLKEHLFDKKLSAEMLSIKQNIYEKDQQNTGTPRLGLKPEWADEINENPNVDHLFPQEHIYYINSTDSRISSKVKSFLDVEERHNESKNKVVDRHAPAVESIQRLGHTCTSGKNSINPLQVGTKEHRSACTDSCKCNDCPKTTMYYTLMPYYVPYEQFAPYHFKEVTNTFSQENLYYDEREDEKVIKKSHKCEGEFEVNNESQETKVKWDTAFLEARPDKLLSDLVNDLYMSYPDSVIKRCYCTSSSYQLSVNLSQIVIFSFIFRNILVNFW